MADNDLQKDPSSEISTRDDEVTENAVDYLAEFIIAAEKGKPLDTESCSMARLHLQALRNRGKTSEAKYWKQVALYLSSVLAATAESLMMTKSTSKRERDRQVSICKTAFDMIHGRMFERKPNQDFVVKRLKDVFEGK